MTDHETLELRRIAAADPDHPTGPDLAALRSAGRSRLARRRTTVGGVATGVAAAVIAPAILLGGGSDSATDPAGPAAAADPSTAPASGPECGTLSCVDPQAEPEEGTLLSEPLVVGTLPSGVEEILYVVRTDGFDAGRKAEVDVVKAGYREDGKIYGTVWAVQPSDAPPAPRFWSNAGVVNAPPGTGDHYTVLGYVDGAPEEITWSTPDGETGRVDNMLRMDGYTAFQLTLPLPEDAREQSRVTRNADGSITIETEDGPRRIEEGDEVTLEELRRGETDGGFPPDLTIRTSDGWSCSLEKCGSMG